MDSTDLAFDLDRYRLMLEELHDAAVDSKKETIERANGLRDAAWRYFRRVRKTEEVWTGLRSLLTHPKKMVRVWVAVEMLLARRTEGWATLLADVVPGARRTGATEEEQTKNRAAHMYGYLTMMTRAKFLDELNLTPSLSEMEDLWLAEGRIGHRFIRVD